MSDPTPGTGSGWESVTTGGGAATPLKPLPKVQDGTSLIDPNGNQVVVTIQNGVPMVRTAASRNSSFMSDTVGHTSQPLAPGPYKIPGTNQVVNISADGSIVSQDAGVTPTRPDISPATGPNGQPIPGLYMVDGKLMTEDQIGKAFGGGSGGGSGQLVGATAPNPAEALSQMLAFYQQEVANGQMPREQAKEDFTRWHTMVNDQLNSDTNAINAVHYQSADQANFDTNAINKANNEDTSLRLRQEDAQTRATNIQQERTKRQQDLSQNILPNSVAGMGAMNIPLIGNMPLTQIDPNTYADIPGLNQIPGVSQSLGAQAPAPMAPMQIPVPGPIDMSQAPTYPGYQPPQLPDIAGLLQQIISGNPGHVVYT